MATKISKLKIPSAAKARKYFQDKMGFTTGPVELERWVKQGQPVNIVDVRAAEDYAEKTGSPCSTVTRTCAIWPQPQRWNSPARATR